MIGLGFAEILMVALLGGGMNSTDLVTLVPPAHYFQARQIEVTLDKMVELAGREPKDPKTQVQQLVALRHLADESDNLKKAANYAVHRQTLAQIAQGNKAADPSGFAKEYAQRVLAKLDGTKEGAVKTKVLRDDALSWFPANATFACAIDLQQPGGPNVNDSVKEILKLMPDQAKSEMYDFIEKTGNLRIERIAFATVSSSEKRDEQQMYLRITGKGNHTWTADAIRTMMRGQPGETKQWKDEQGTPITLLIDKGNSPAMLVIGNSDFVLTGFNRPQGKDRELVDVLMDTRAKKKPNAAAGPLKALLAKVPTKAVALAVGALPSDLQREMRRGFGAAPEKFIAFIERVPTGMDMQVEATMANAEESRAFVQKIGALRQQGIDELKMAMKQPLPPEFPAVPFQALIDALGNLQAQTQGDKVNARVLVPDTLIQQMGTMGTMLFGVRTRKVDKN